MYRKLKKINLKRVVLYNFKSRFDGKNLSNNLNEYKKEINNFLFNRFNYLESYIFDFTRRSNSKKGAEISMEEGNQLKEHM